MKRPNLAPLLLLLMVAALAAPALAAPEPYLALMKSGEFKAAYDLLKPQLLDRAGADPETIPARLRAAVTCLQRINRVNEVDALLEKVVATHQDRWYVYPAAAEQYGNLPHYGYVIADDFRRGNHRGGGKVVNAHDRDRVRQLQLYLRAIELFKKERPDDKLALQPLLEDLAATLRSTPAEMLRLTDVSKLPDYEDGWNHRGANGGAPVDTDGEPIFFDVPESWDAATSDGERWRWALAEMVRCHPDFVMEDLERRVEFTKRYYGVRTLAQFGRRGMPVQDGKSSTFDLHTLGEDETIARLATGVRRFKLPAEHNHIVLYRKLIEIQRKRGAAAATGSLVELARTFEDRRQYKQAAEIWRQAEACNTVQWRPTIESSLEQIKAPLGAFESTPTQPAGVGAKLNFLFRNATRVALTARRVEVGKLLEDVRRYLESQPKKLDSKRFQIRQLGRRLLEEEGSKYLGEEVARWSRELQPADNHFDKRVTIDTPLETAGAYWVSAKASLDDDDNEGNTTKILLWVADTTIVSKRLDGKMMYFVADARTGRPVPGAQLDFFGWRQERLKKPNRFRVDTARFARNADADGMVVVNPLDWAGGDKPTKQDDGRELFGSKVEEMQWLVVAKNEQGRRAFLGFDSIWFPDEGNRRPRGGNVAKAVVLTDRPVYRPGQPVHFKAWVARARHDQSADAENEFAHKAFRVEIYNPKNEKIEARQLTANAYGGVEGDFTPEESAPLGVYRIAVAGYGSGSFRVEEYKKPEYEVTVDAPTEAVRLGETFAATIAARYYFGSPVTNATVKYKVVRTARSAEWFPVMPWDWLYGPGYWWPCGDDRWYPGWSRWGCRLPTPRWSWWWRPTPPPEVIAEGEVPIGDDGTLRVAIDTALAKQQHGDTDHEYQITAEVVDQSRRTIVGSGRVLAARTTVQTLAWLDRGYYAAGDPVTVRIATRRPDGEPLAAGGVLRLLRVSYPPTEVASGQRPQPKETEVRRWDLATDTTGAAELQFKASEPGRYRISYTAKNGEGEAADEAESGCLFTVTGDGYESDRFEFDDLQVVLDKQEYQPGETANLRVSTNQRDGVVLLFVRATTNGWWSAGYSEPWVLRLDGKTTTVPIKITRGDMPNFFVEAITVHNGRVHTRVREVIVPPASRVAKIEVLPSAEAYLPGQPAKVKLRVTDAAGKPVMGDTVVSIYDRSVDAIAGRSGTLDLREYFWAWKRSHAPVTTDSLGRVEQGLQPGGETDLKPIGVFGWRSVDEITFDNDLPKSQSGGGGFGGGGFGGGGGGFFGAVPQVAPAVALARSATGDAFAAEAESSTATQPLVEPPVRSEFADTALWVGSIETDADGLAEVELTMPENLTAWRVRAWSLSSGTRVGQGEAEVVTRKNLLVRLQTPRFLVDSDEVVLSANVHNYLDKIKQVEVRLALEGGVLEATTDSLTQTVTIAAGGEARVDWRVKAIREGETAVIASALTDEESDAMQLKLPVNVHGAERVESFTGVVAKGNRIGAFEINVPRERRVEQTRFELRYSPTLVGTMVDALPYLIEYPHGCTEQTLNRFLPAVLTQRTLEHLGVDLNKAENQVTRPGAHNPVYDQAKLNKIVRAGVQRLQDMQLSDGGWGWFSGYSEQSTAHTTAVVVRGLLIAQQNDVAIVDGVIERGVAWLERYQAEELQKLRNAATETDPYKRHADNIDALVFAVLAEAGKRSREMEKQLMDDRLRLQPYTLAMLGHALHLHKNVADRDQVIRNLKQLVVTDAENQTAYLNLPDGAWWYWYGSEFEAHAYCLKLLAATEPESDLTAGIVKYLVNNRRHASYWNSTRDTALVIEAMADYLAASQEGASDMTIEVWVDGEKRKESTVSAADALLFEGQFELTGAALSPGRHTIELRKTSPDNATGGRLYYSATLANFSLEDDLRAAGLEVRVKRKLFKLTPMDKTKPVAGSRGEPIDQRVEKLQRTEIANLGNVVSGDLVEVELTIDSKNDYEYLLITDPKAAGFEPVELRSGYNGNELGAYVEYRDAVVNLFARRIARGKHSVTYRLRAETPGRFTTLPTQVAAMYAPKLRGNSNELKVRVEDRSE